jgi:hypothetical protein
LPHLSKNTANFVPSNIVQKFTAHCILICSNLLIILIKATTQNEIIYLTNMKIFFSYLSFLLVVSLSFRLVTHVIFLFPCSLLHYYLHELGTLRVRFQRFSHIFLLLSPFSV